MAEEVTTTEQAAAPVEPKVLNNLPFHEQMEQLGWDKDEKYDSVPEALGAKARAAEAAEEKEEKKPEKPKREPKPAAPEPVEAKNDQTDPNAEKLEQLKGLIADLGYLLEDGKVTTKERAEIRLARKQLREEQQRVEADSLKRIEEAAKKVEEREAGLAPKLTKVEQFEKAVADGDHEAIAKLAGFDSYDKWQEHIIALKADPAYKRLRALEQLTAERDKAEKERSEKEARERTEREQREQAEAQQRQQIEARNNYMRGLSERMAKSSDPLVKTMADDPSFVGAVFRVQQEHWRATETELPPEQAIRTALQGTSAPLMAEMQRLYEKLAPIFGKVQAAAVAKAAVTAPEPAKPKTRTPQPVNPPAPSAKKFNDREWKEQARRQMEEAAREEAMARRGSRKVG